MRWDNLSREDKGSYSNHPAGAAGTGRVPPARSFIRPSSVGSYAFATRVAHCRHTNATTTCAGGNQAGTLLRRVQLKKKKKKKNKTTTTTKSAAAAAAAAATQRKK